MRMQIRLLLFTLFIFHLPSSWAGGYVWEDGKWVWKDNAESVTEDTNYSYGGEEEGSADYYDDGDYDYDAEGSGIDRDYEDTRQEAGGNKDDIYSSNISPDRDPYKNNDDIDIVDDVTTTTTTTVAPTTLRTTTTTKKSVLGSNLHPTSFFAQPGILAAVVGGAVVGLLCAILLVMFIVYRMRKKDEGSYALDEPRRSPNVHLYSKAPTREFFA